MPESDGVFEPGPHSDNPSPESASSASKLEETPIHDSELISSDELGDHDDLVIPSANRLMTMVVGVEFLLILIAMLVAWTGFRDSQTPLSGFLDDSAFQQIGWGVLCSLALLVLVFGTRRVPFFREFHELINQKVAPLFRSMQLYQIAIVSLAAGVGEELLFRWCLQGGLMQYLDVVFAVAVASVVFGLLHWLSFSYFLIATVMGAILGWIYLSVGPLAAIVCHAFYDFFAIQKLVLDQRER